MPEKQTDQALPGLSPREQEIADRYAAGETSAKIAEALCISQTTVRNHVAAIYRKLEINNKTELVNLKVSAAVEINYADPPFETESAGTSFTDQSLALLQAQLRATNDILRVISHSPGDIDAIFDVILDYALSLSHSQFGGVYACIDKGFSAVGLKNVPIAFREYLQAATIYPNPGTALGRMQRQHRIIHIADVRSEDLYPSGDPLRVATVDLGGARSFVAIPMIHRDTLVGAFTIYRQEVRPFSHQELNLLQTFSDQAAIALTITSLIDDRRRLLDHLEQQKTTIAGLKQQFGTD